MKSTQAQAIAIAPIRWAMFLRERFPFLVYLILTLGFAVSGRFLAFSQWKGLGVSVSLLGLILFFMELRIMDELKDYEKDLVAHPDRPLPRGLISVEEARAAVHALLGCMGLFAIGAGLFCGIAAGVVYALMTAYLWLMYREFYVGSALSGYPLLYAFSHQIILVPLCIFSVAVHNSGFAFQADALSYAFCVFGAFFAYEICRKLDPKANPILKTYLSQYGVAKTVTIVLALLGVAALAAQSLDFHFLWPVEGALAISLIWMAQNPLKFKWVEAIASLSLALHIWSVAIYRSFEQFK